MTKELEKEFRESLYTGRMYDFVAEHYWEMTKEELKELVLNLDWVATKGLTDGEIKNLYAQLEDELENRDFFIED